MALTSKQLPHLLKKLILSLQNIAYPNNLDNYEQLRAIKSRTPWRYLFKMQAILMGKLSP
jgi:hypothetical protein